MSFLQVALKVPAEGGGEHERLHRESVGIISALLDETAVRVCALEIFVYSFFSGGAKSVKKEKG